MTKIKQHAIIGVLALLWTAVLGSVMLQSSFAAENADTPLPVASVSPAEAPLPELGTQPLDLTPHFVQGRTSRYAIWQQRSQHEVLQMGGQQRENSTMITLTGEVTWTVAKVRPDGSATCTMTNDKLRMVIEASDGTKVVCDTTLPSGDNETMYRFLKALVNVPIAVEMSADGKALSVSGQQVVKQRLGSDLQQMAPADEDFLQDATDAITLSGASATTAMNNQWSQAFDWSHEVGRMRLNMQYQLVNAEWIAGIPIATINQTAKPVIIPDYSKIPPGGPKVHIQQTNGNFQYQILFDLQRHEAVGSNAIREIGLRTTITLPKNNILTRQLNEEVQVQTLRIAEQ